MRAEAAALIDALTDEELARRLDALVDLAGAEIYLDRFEEAGSTPNARCRSDGQPARTSCSPESTRPSAWPGACSAGWPKPPSCSTPRSRPGACPGTRRRWRGRSSAARSSRFPPATLEVAIATAEESLDLATAGGQSRHRRPRSVGPGHRSHQRRRADAPRPPSRGRRHRAFDALPDDWKAYFLELMTRYWLAHDDRDAAERAAAGAQASATAAGLRLPTAMAYRRQPRRSPSPTATRARPPTGRWLPPISPTPSARPSRPASPGSSPAGHWRISVTAIARSRCSSRRPPSSIAAAPRATATRPSRSCAVSGSAIHRRTRPGDSEQTGVATLTARELEIARLIVDRKTNAEIASELFLSKKTVETHIRNMFRKLDANSRVEIARAVEKADKVLADLSQQR